MKRYATILRMKYPNFLSTKDSIPHRFLLRTKDNFFRMIDLQVVEESNNGFSIYLKPPLDYLYEGNFLEKKVGLFDGLKYKISFNDNNKVNLLFNPYLSWHGRSGKLHLNAYETRHLKKKRVIKDSAAIDLTNIDKHPRPIFSVVFPINEQSFYRTTPPPKGFSGTYVEVSKNPYMQNQFSGEYLNYVLDKELLNLSGIVMDVLVHQKGSEFSLENHHFPDNTEIISLGPPVTIDLVNQSLPTISVFLYQNVEKTNEYLHKPHYTVLWGRSKDQKEEMFAAYKPVT